MAAGVYPDEEEAPPLQAQANERDISINIHLPDPNTPNTTNDVMLEIAANIEDQIATIKAEMDDAYGTHLRDGMRSRHQ
eukprot:10278024-Ditylum_brightwellii.AAC.1